jgi:hypothetical protein
MPSSSTSRYIPNNPSTLLTVPSPKQEVTSSLTQLIQSYPPKSHYSLSGCHGLFQGPTSIAYLFLHISNILPDLRLPDKKGRCFSPFELCNDYLSGRRPDGHIDSNHCGVICEALAFLAVRVAASGSRTSDEEEGGNGEGRSQLNDITAFLGYLPQVIASDGRIEAERGGRTKGSNEWLYGRAGTLYLLRLMRRYAPLYKNILDEAIQEIMDAILEQGPEWEWYGKRYLGAVHGDIGIVTQIALSCCPLSTKSDGSSNPDGYENNSILNFLAPILETTLKQQFPDGNLPSKPGGSSSELVQFCHGATGLVISLQSLLHKNLFTSLHPQMRTAIQRAQEVIWSRGLLTKEPCLCHGISSNALALEDPAKREHFLAYTVQDAVQRGWEEGLFRKSSDPFGLYYGVAGRVWGILELMRGQDGREMGAFIGYSDV